jgi:hypothetical protein
MVPGPTRGGGDTVEIAFDVAIPATTFNCR